MTLLPWRAKAQETDSEDVSFGDLALPLVPSLYNVARWLTRDDGEYFGLSVFITEGDRVLRTYFTSGRGVEALGSVWTFLDLTPLGRQEQWEDSPPDRPQGEPYTWWRRHDEYERS